MSSKNLRSGKMSLKHAVKGRSNHDGYKKRQKIPSLTPLKHCTSSYTDVRVVNFDKPPIILSEGFIQNKKKSSRDPKRSPITVPDNSMCITRTIQTTSSKSMSQPCILSAVELPCPDTKTTALLQDIFSVYWHSYDIQ